MKEIVSHCPICNNKADIEEFDFRDTLKVKCPRCGKFKISLWGLKSSNLHLYKDGKALLSYYIRNFGSSSEILDNKLINEILKENELPDFETKFLNLLLWFAIQSNYSTETIDGNNNELVSLIGAKDEREIAEILDEIWNEKYIEMENPTVGPLREKIFNGFAAHLTRKGINYLKEKSSNEKLSKSSKNNSLEDNNMKIFISYSWKNIEIVDKIDNFFKLNGITLIRDERAIKYKESIKEYMKGIRKTDFVLMIVSEAFLKAINCMYEVLEFIKDENYRNRILPIFLNDVNIFSTDERIEYINYWNCEFEKLEYKIKQLPADSLIPMIEDLKHLKNVRDNIAQFMSALIDMKTFYYEELETIKYKPILDHLKILYISEKEKVKNLQSFNKVLEFAKNSLIEWDKSNPPSAKANIKVSLDLSNNPGKLFIKNIGDTYASNVVFTMTTEMGKDLPFIKSDYDRIFPLSKLESDDDVWLMAPIDSSTGFKFDIICSWNNPDGTKENRQYILHR